MKVNAGVGTGRYILWGGSCEEMVYCIVLNSKFTLQGFITEKLLKMTPVQIKTKLSRVIAHPWVCKVSLKSHVGDFFYWISEEKKHFQNQRDTYALFKGISMMFKNVIDIAIVNS